MSFAKLFPEGTLKNLYTNNRLNLLRVFARLCEDDEPGKGRRRPRQARRANAKACRLEVWDRSGLGAAHRAPAGILDGEAFSSGRGGEQSGIYSTHAAE